jgi:hypothetical protein
MTNQTAQTKEGATPWPLAERPHDRWTPVADLCVAPDADQQQLVDAVRAALDAGRYYNDEVYAFVTDRMAARLTPEMLQTGIRQSERGRFGIEIYHARRYLDALNLQQRLRDAFAQLDARRGMPLGPLIFTDRKQISCCEVVDVNAATGFITLRGKRGRHEVQLEATALSILNARERYAERRRNRTGLPRTVHRLAARLA